MNILKLQNSISWEYHKWNNAVLFLEQILTWISKVVIFAVYLSSSTHINQFRTHTRKLVASYTKMKDLESNLAGVNVAILPVGKQHEIVNMKFLKGFDKDTEKKSRTCDESGAHDRISLWHLLTKFEKLEKSEFWKNEKKLLKISSFYTCVPKTIIIWGPVPEVQYPPILTMQKTKILKNWKTCTTKNTTKWCMLTQISSATDTFLQF